jgi:glycosyltransferase involved in cell wall biosynthesis
MNILYIASNYIPATGGTELSDSTLLNNLAKRGHDVSVVTYSDLFSDTASNPKIYRLSEKDPTNFINSLISSKNPDIIYTTLGWSRHAIRIGKCSNIPTVLYVSSIEYGDNLAIGKPFAPDYIITTSEFARKRIFEQSDRDSIVISPRIDFQRFDPSKNSPEYVTLINPVKIKGSDIFYRLVAEMPDVKFLSKSAWNNLKKDGVWDTNRLQLIAESLGDELVIPKEDISPIFPNLVSINNEKDISWVYNKTKILLSPSLWEETYGRTNVEAMYHGIPVIASNRGGIPESTDGAAILINNPENFLEWKNALQNVLDNDLLFRKMQEESISRASRYSLNDIISKAETFFSTVCINK